MLISVITVCFNSVDTIHDTLTSVQNQIGVEFEHIIIDGNSNDGTLEIVNKFPHVKHLVSEPDDGLYHAMNKGLNLASGDLVGFLNADDFLCASNALALIADSALSNSSDVVIADVAMFDSEKNNEVKRYYGIRNYYKWMIRFGHMPPHPTFYAKPDLLRRIGGFNQKYKIGGDFDLILRLLFKLPIKISKVPKVLVKFRYGGISTSGRSSRTTLTNEIAQSLSQAGFSFPKTRARIRYIFKISQFLIIRK